MQFCPSVVTLRPRCRSVQDRGGRGSEHRGGLAVVPGGRRVQVVQRAHGLRIPVHEQQGGGAAGRAGGCLRPSGRTSHARATAVFDRTRTGGTDRGVGDGVGDAVTSAVSHGSASSVQAAKMETRQK